MYSDIVNILISVPDTHPADLRTKSGLFFTMLMYEEIPQALSISEQIELLKHNNLEIEDEEEAARILNEVSYCRLVKAYGTTFRNKNGRFNDRISFETIWRVYEFDDQLRQLLIPYIQRIEISLRCRISNYFSTKYGVLGYKDEANFDDFCDYKELIRKIDVALTQGKDSPLIKKCMINYGDVPLYATIEVFSFGTLALFFSSMKPDDRKEISKLYQNVDDYYLSSWLVSIGYVRNLCAHFNRLYNKSLIKSPRMYRKQDGDVDNKTLFSVLCCMRYLYSEYGDWGSFVGAFEDLLNEYKDCVKPERLGCIPNWKDKLLDHETSVLFI